jgi:hypothetical protein
MKASWRGVAGTPLLWRKAPGQKRTWTLLDGDETLATLRREKALGTLATGEAAGRRWTFKRVGFFRVRVTIRPEGSDQEIGVFHPRWTGGGELALADGRRFGWGQTSFWRQEWIFVAGEADELIRFRCGWSMAKAEVTISPSGGRVAELPLLAVLGWYLILLSADDAGAGAAVTAATSG